MRVRVAAVWFELLFLVGWLSVDIMRGFETPTISDLVYGSGSAVVVAAFLLHGASLGALAWGRPRSRIPLVVGAVGMLVASVAWTDPPGQSSWVGTAHTIGALMAFGGVAVAAWLERRELPIVPLSLAVVLGTIILAGLAQERTGLAVWERGQAILNGAWIINAALSRR